MDSTPALSVVVPTRNRAKLLRDCIESLKSQDFPSDRYEIIVVDDGSTDKTPEIVPALNNAGGSLTLSYVASDGRGLNAARNKGVRTARSDLILFVDDDVEVPPSWLKAFADGSSRHPTAGCLGGQIKLRLEGKPPRLCGREALGETELDLGDKEISVAAVWGANMAVRRWALDLVGPFNDSLPLYGDEEEWQLRLHKAGVAIMYLPEAWLWHRRTQNDLRLTTLIRTRFRKGIGSVALARAAGQPVSLWRELSRIPRYLGHGIRRRCYWGLLASALQAGRVWACLRTW